MEPSRTPRFGGDPTETDAAKLLASNHVLMRELVDEIKELREKQTGPPSRGSGSSRARIINAVVTVALGAALGAHALLWYLDKTVAVHTTLIERVMEDVRGHLSEADRDHAEIRNRVRELERGRDR